MPEIIKRGPENWEVRCRKCTCTFRYKLDEVRRNYAKASDGVNCPQCGEWFIHHPIIKLEKDAVLM